MESPRAVGEMAEDVAGMDQVEGLGREWVGEDVEPAHLEARTAVGLEQGGVEVDGEHRAVDADLGGEPAGDRAVAGADLETAPSRSDPGALQLGDGQRVAAALQGVEALGLTLPPLVEDVSRHVVTPGAPGA